MKNKFSHFNKVAECRCCKKKTHSSIDGCDDINLCRVCYESAGIENEHNDSGHTEKVSDCPLCNNVGCMHMHKEVL